MIYEEYDRRNCRQAFPAYQSDAISAAKNSRASFEALLLKAYLKISVVILILLGMFLPDSLADEEEHNR